MANAVAEIVELVGLFKELGANLQLPVKLYCDSKETLQIVANQIYHERTKHIESTAILSWRRSKKVYYIAHFYNTKLGRHLDKEFGQGIT